MMIMGTDDLKVKVSLQFFIYFLLVCDSAGIKFKLMKTTHKFFLMAGMVVPFSVADG